MNNLEQDIKEAEQVFKNNFPMETWFERAIFFSWSCAIKDCGFCYMSTQEKRNRNDDDKSIRSRESIYAETILCKVLGWRIGFFSGGINSFNQHQITEMLAVIHEILGEKIWINLGPVPPNFLEKYSPYIRGVVGSIETVNEKIHKVVCPSKPIAPYEKMFEYSQKLGLENAMTLILGLGETENDFPKLLEFIKKNNISKIHVYALNPVDGTMFEGAESPSAEYHAWWIANIRKQFPTIDIQMGIWTDKLNRIDMLLRAGSNSISKFPAIRKFGKKESIALEKNAEKAGRKFLGTLTKMPEYDWDSEVDRLNLDQDMKEKIKAKLHQYLSKMK